MEERIISNIQPKMQWTLRERTPNPGSAVSPSKEIGQTVHYLEC